jgi:hypothetical protein
MDAPARVTRQVDKGVILRNCIRVAKLAQMVQRNKVLSIGVVCVLVYMLCGS